MRPIIYIAISAAALAAATAAHAADTTVDSGADFNGWELRARAVYLKPSSNTLDYTSVSGQTTFEASGEWALPSNFSLEVAVGTPTDYSLNSGGESVRLMPSTFTGKYSLLPSESFRAYVGAGLHITSVSLSNSGTDGISGSSVGPAIQAGMEMRVGGNWFVNADFRYLDRMDPSGRIGGAPRTIKLDPTFFGLGIGYHWRL